MADVQKENGYFEFANELADVFAMVNLAAYQWRVLWAIWRKTYGWKKKADYISFTQLEKMTGLDRRHIVRTVKELETMQIIIVERDSTRSAKYAFQKDYEKWQLLPNGATATKKQLLPNEDTTIALSGNETVALSGTHKRKKEIYKKNMAQKLCDKESLSCFLNKKSLSFSLSINAMILEFINKVRMANKHKAIAAARAVKLADALAAIAGKYGADNMAAGIQAAFKKADREGFNFSGHDPAAYVRAVAKGECSKTRQQQAEAAHQAEKAALRAAPASGLWNEIQESFSA